MFGPNCTTAIHQEVAMHHREPAFSDVLDRLREAFRRRLGVGEPWDLLFITGSGTLGVEAAVASLAAPARGPAVRGEHTGRLRRMMAAHGVLDDGAAMGCDVALETSCSLPLEGPAPFFLDAVSGFPYYAIPSGTRLWVTVSSKQLGAPPVLAVVAVHRDAWPGLRGPERSSYLNLARHREAAQRGQTAHTPAIPLYQDLAQRLESFDVARLRARIDANSDRLVAALGRENVVGRPRCPVLTVPKQCVPAAVAQRFRLYGLHTDGPHYHVFTYSEPEARYDELCEALA